LPRPRDRHTIHHDPQYYRIRNHLVDFLIKRSRLYQTGSIVKLKPLRRLA
jgi:nitrate/nitrite transport system ATP-binding protein